METEETTIDMLERPEVAAPQALNVRHAAIMTAALGIVHSVLLLLAFGLVAWRSPGIRGSDEEWVAYYNDPDDRRIVIFAGLYLLPFAGIAFIWFTVELRMWLTGSVQRLTPLLSNVLLVCGIIYVALLFCAGAAMSVVAVTAEFDDVALEATIAKQFPQFGSAILLVFAMRMAAMTVFAMSNIGRTHGVLPKWFAYLGFLLGVALLLTASLNPWLVALFPTWVLIFSLILLDKARKIPKDLEIEREPARSRR